MAGVDFAERGQEGVKMICPRCKTSDVHVSRRSNEHLLSFLWVNMRCHRCCHLFTVPRWKVQADSEKPSENGRKAA